MSPFLYGHQTEFAYSRCGLTIEVAEIGDRLATIDVGRKVGTTVPLSVGELGPHLTQCHLD